MGPVSHEPPQTHKNGGVAGLLLLKVKGWTEGTGKAAAAAAFGRRRQNQVTIWYATDFISIISFRPTVYDGLVSVQKKKKKFIVLLYSDPFVWTVGHKIPRTHRRYQAFPTCRLYTRAGNLAWMC